MSYREHDGDDDSDDGHAYGGSDQADCDVDVIERWPRVRSLPRHRVEVEPRQRIVVNDVFRDAAEEPERPRY